jgi:hypothetical protein
MLMTRLLDDMLGQKVKKFNVEHEMQNVMHYKIGTYTVYVNFIILRFPSYFMWTDVWTSFAVKLGYVSCTKNIAQSIVFVMFIHTISNWTTSLCLKMYRSFEFRVWDQNCFAVKSLVKGEFQWYCLFFIAVHIVIFYNASFVSPGVQNIIVSLMYCPRAIKRNSNGIADVMLVKKEF